MIMQAESLGRRERKKAETRQRVAASALRLFLEHGYDEVGIREVASDADVAVTTLFLHFPSKEALVFEQDGVFQQRLVEAVSDRGTDESLIAALRREVERMVIHCTSERARPIWRMIDNSTELQAYEESMLARHSDSLAAAIAADPSLSGTPSTNRAIARFVTTAYSLARSSDSPGAALDEIFAMIEAAWEASPHSVHSPGGSTSSG